MRYIFLFVVLFSCSEIELKKPYNLYCFKMTISDSNPIQFWVNGQETFNELNPICGLTQVCFCQQFNCTDEIKIQISDDPGLIFELVIYDSDSSEIVRLDFDEVSDGIYQISFIGENESPLICEKIQLAIEQLSLSDFEAQSSAADNDWESVAYGDGLFAAVASSGTGNRVMTSPDGINWTIQSSAADNNWRDVAYGEGDLGPTFIAVANSGVGNRIMISTDGTSWSPVGSPADNNWNAVTFGNGIFVAVANTGAQRVMTSSDGINWTLRNAAAANDWTDVTFGNGLFVAVATSGTGDRIMTSTDGITWTSRTNPSDVNWRVVGYGNNMFVALSNTGFPNNIMTSTDGITWVDGTGPTNLQWDAIAYGNGFFVIGATTGSSPKTMYSTDAITWVDMDTPGSKDIFGLAFGVDRFVGVSNDGTGDRVILAILNNTELAKSDCIDLRNNHQCTKLIEYTNSSDFDGITYEISPQPTFYLRVPAQLWKEDNPQTQEDLELSNGVIVTLRQTIQEKTLLELGYMPPYMHKKVQKILMHDTVIIDGIQWKRRDPYESESLKDYPLKTANVLLTKYNSVLKNTI